jgi:histidyl-tRNA synthetase
VELLCNCGGGGVKAQFKRADRSGARFALVLGDTEIQQDSVVLKPLRSGEEQVLIRRDTLIDDLRERFTR